ncbi:nicotinamide N-methyltransferase protein [Rutstroemia sp. NJR-2017a BVV2]|nr:nicotinamide N-methyltransferase protein [Rutstroemia sp. NJR-2017a BVV2]
MAPDNPPLDNWLDEQVRSISGLSVGNSDASIPRQHPDISNIIPGVDGTSGSTLPSTRQVIQPSPSRRSSSHSVSTTSQSADSVFSAPSASSDDTATTYTPENEPINSVLTLHCDFGMIDCQIGFPTTQFQHWYDHVLSHFGPLLPPPKCVCLYCPQEFKDELHPLENWRRRMIHCHAHIVAEGYIPPRPDFWLIDYLRETNLISAQDADRAESHTERPRVAGLVPHDFKTEETKLRNERNQTCPNDIRKEERERKKAIPKTNKK